MIYYYLPSYISLEDRVDESLSWPHLQYIDQETYEAIKVGQEIAMKRHYLAAVTLLTVQLEDLLRHIALIDEPVTAQSKLTMSLLLKRLDTRLPDSILEEIRYLLKGVDGINLRDKTAHGHLKLSDCDQTLTERLLRLIDRLDLTMKNYVQKK